MSEFIIDRLISTAHALKESHAYSASVVEEGIAEITRLRQLLSEAEKREREARAKALEEAAAVAEEQAEMRERLFNENGTSHNAIRAAQSLIIAERIRALQSEAGHVTSQ